MNTQQQIEAVRFQLSMVEASRKSIALSGDTTALKMIDQHIAKLNAKFLSLCASK